MELKLDQSANLATMRLGNYQAPVYLSVYKPDPVAEPKAVDIGKPPPGVTPKQWNNPEVRDIIKKKGFVPGSIPGVEAPKKRRDKERTHGLFLIKPR